jgi:hypothetical protein
VVGTPYRSSSYPCYVTEKYGVSGVTLSGRLPFIVASASPQPRFANNLDTYRDLIPLGRSDFLSLATWFGFQLLQCRSGRIRGSNINPGPKKAEGTFIAK